MAEIQGARTSERAGERGCRGRSTALAHIAATALTSDGRELVEVAGRRFCNMSLALREQVST